MKKWLSKINAEADQTQRCEIETTLLAGADREEKDLEDVESLKSLREDVHDKMGGIKDLVHRVVLVQMEHASDASTPPDKEEWVLFPDEWTRVSKSNICARLCSMDERSKDSTVINVMAKPGAVIDPHKHDRVETIFVVEGSYVDSVTGKEFTEGDVETIPAGELHGLSSEEGCLLVIKWRPAFPYKEASESDKSNARICRGAF